VYVTAVRCEDRACKAVDYSLLRVAKTGGVLELVGEGWGQIAVDADHAYVETIGLQPRLLRYPLSGGGPTTLATGFGYGGPGVAVSDKNVYFDGGGDYFTSVLSVPIEGGPVSTLSEIGGDILFLVGRKRLQADILYTRGEGQVLAVSVTDGGLGVLFEGACLRADIDADSSFVYWNVSPNQSYLGGWSEYGSLGSLERMALDGTHTVLSQSIDDFRAVRLDDHNVYFVRGHQILRLPK
jgi:hypothetical protein